MDDKNESSAHDVLYEYLFILIGGKLCCCWMIFCAMKRSSLFEKEHVSCGEILII